MAYQNVFQLTIKERDELFLALDKIAYDPAGGDTYIHDIRVAMLSSLPRRISIALTQQRASVKPQPYLILKNVPVDRKSFSRHAPINIRHRPNPETSVKKHTACGSCAGTVL